MSAAYSAVAAWRRGWYARAPERRRRLARPVVSVGNLRVGGTGKTPAAEYIARLLVACGERPAVLTRGYARRLALDGVTVVSDGVAVRADLDAAGDEPLMLARALPGVAVLVGADRYVSGCLAERRLGATVHILDDGFQHLQLDRDVDLLLVSEDDLNDRPLPGGRLREGIAAAAVADAALVTAGYDTAAERVGRGLGLSTVFRVTRAIGAPRMVASRESVVVPAASRVFVVAGIARPERFAADVAAAGWEIAGELTFRDHHRFDNRDVRRIAEAARTAGSAIVLTTEKDAVRLAACNLDGVPIASVPLMVGIEPAVAFRDWLLARLRAQRAAPATEHQAPSTQHPAPSTQHPAPSTQHPAPERMKHHLQYAIVRTLIAIVRAMPDALVRACGTVLGLTFYVVDGAHRRIAARNLATAFPIRPAAERRAIARAAFAHFGRLLFELLKFSTLSRDAMLARVEFDGEERARLAYAQGKGVLFVTGHFGFWELHAMVHALRIEPIALVARALDNPRLNDLLEQIRQRTGNTVMYRRGTVRRVMRALQAKQGIAVLIDQHVMSRDAIYVDFFERPAATTSTVAALALRTGAPVVPVFALPLGGGRYRMIYEHPVEPPRGETEDAVREFTQRCTDVLEMYVRRHPELWLWMHRRWREEGPAADEVPGMFPAAEGDVE